MAIFKTTLVPTDTHPVSHDTGIAIETWTEQTASALNNLSLQDPSNAQVNSVTLQIPLDDEHPTPSVAGKKPSGVSSRQASGMQRGEILRRDSLKRRELLLKGKDGSRRRQRWENDRLLSNPHAQPPLPSDWEVRPTYPVRGVPYYLAPLWDAGLAAKSLARKTGENKAKLQRAVDGDNGGDGDKKGKIPRELREKLKRSRGAKGLLQDLETEVRRFVEGLDEHDREMVREGLLDPDSEDEEIVFVGRRGQMSDMPSPTARVPQREKLLFDSPLNDQGANFGRWLVHHIGNYYGLQTWSVTVGDPARREAYVGVKEMSLKSGYRVSPRGPLPQPLWGLV